MVFTQTHRVSRIKALVMISIAAGFLSVLFAQSYTGEPSNRVKINLGETPWKFSKSDPSTAKDSAYSDNSWSDVGIPHCFNANDTWRNCQNGTCDRWRGTAWYRKHVFIPASYSGRRIEVEFQGVNDGCAVYVNGRFKPSISKVSGNSNATHVNGAIPFVVDITNDITYGAQNVIAVRAGNNGGFYAGSGFSSYGMGLGGMHRPVFLHVTDKIHVPLNVYSNIRRWGTYVGTLEASDQSAKVKMQTNVYNDDAQEKSVTVTTKIVDAQNNVVATQTTAAQTVAANSSFIFDQTATIANPKLWYPNNNAGGKPYMHKVYHIVQVGGKTVDVFTSPLGIRVITWDKDYAYYNGKKQIMWGGGCRYEYPGFGSAMPEEQHWRDMKLLADCGGSMLRPGHASIATQTVEACDEYGICLIQPSGDGEWNIVVGSNAYNYKDENHRDVLIRDRNHPSIAAWELNNGAKIAQSGGLIKRLIDTVKLYDHIRPRASHSRDESDYLPTVQGELILGNSYSFNRSGTKMNYPYFCAESWMSANARYSYNWEVQHTDAYVDERNKVLRDKGLGYAHWMFMECSEESYKQFLDPSISTSQNKTLGCSMIDHNRIPKLIYNVCKSAIWVPYEIRPGVALQSHWNYAAGTRTVIAYSNCPKVELFLNNVSKGEVTPNASTTKCTWSIAWESGTLRAVGKNATGAVVCSDERKTAGVPAKIVLSLEEPVAKPATGEVFRIRANGSDAAFIIAKVADAQGNWCPLATNNITFKATGQGTYVGSANYVADLSKPTTYHAPGDPELAAEGGLMKVAVRANFTPGTVSVEASSTGLTSSIPVTFQTFDPSIPFSVSAKGAPGIRHSAAATGSRTFRFSGSVFTIPDEFAGKTLSIKVYDLSGKLLRSEIVKTKSISFAKYGIKGPGMKIIQCREVQLNRKK